VGEIFYFKEFLKAFGQVSTIFMSDDLKSTHINTCILASRNRP